MKSQKTKDVYVCQACGNQTLVWQGQCPACREWNTLAARTVAKGAKTAASAPSVPATWTDLEDVEPSAHATKPTGFAELDTLLGGGLVPGAVVLLSGEPGVGKSTLLLQLTGRLAQEGSRAAYVSGEESLPQLRSRAERLGLLGPGLPALGTTSLEDAAALLEADPPFDLLIVDSVQTLASASQDSLPGSPGQVRAVASTLTEAAKKAGTCLVLVGHVTKEGSIAGPKLLEHMVDTVLYLEGDRRHHYRLLRVFKNRHGPSDELAVMEMNQQGLQFIPDPSTYFLSQREEAVAGTAVVMAVDGGRPLAVEVQALVGRSQSAMPRRTALGFDAGRLHLLLAVMERHLNLPTAQLEVHCKIGGGLKLSEPGLDLGLVAAVLSSLSDTPLPADAIFWGEVDLSGLVRPVASHELRLKQARRLGYERKFFSRQGKHGGGTLAGFRQAVFGGE